jgi:hypothetical protein
LHKALDLGKAEINKFECLAHNRAHENINDDELALILTKILSKKEGTYVVIKILAKRLIDKKDEVLKISGNIIILANKVLSKFTPPEKKGEHKNLDYDLAIIAKVLRNDKNSSLAARKICNTLFEGIKNNYFFTTDYPRLLTTLTHSYPHIFLDIFLGSKEIENYQRKRMLSYDFNRNAPLNNISDEDIISWCENDPSFRYPVIVSVFRTFKKLKESDEIEWKPIVYIIFEKAPNLDKVLLQLSDAIRPLSWSGSGTNILCERSFLFQRLFEHNNEEIRTWARCQYDALQKTIKEERKREQSNYSERNESFE